MEDGLGGARDLLPGVRLELVETLRGSERTTTQRVRATYPDRSVRSLIVKRYHSAGEGWVREAAALAVLPAGVPGPTLVASGGEPPIVITADLGPRSSVADALLGRDPQAAAAAVVDWAEAVAALHVGTRDARPAFRAALAQRQGDLPVADTLVALALEDAVRILDRECGALGVRVPVNAFDELRGLAKRLGGAGTAALSPADTCPDNNVRTPSGLVLIDFEAAHWRHVAWDVAYLRAPWPTCWCSWRLPAEVADRAVAAYRRVAATAFPQIAEPEFDRQVSAAAMGWALISTSLFIDNALGSDPPLNPDRPTPTRRAMIMHRLTAAAGSAELPAVAELADRLVTELRTRWGDVPLAYARAFRSDQ
jgi:Phosphotransferase enzyme family